MDILNYINKMQEMYNDKPRPMAQGGRIGFKDGTPDTSPVKTEVYKYPRSNRFGTVYSRTPGKNQYEAMRSLEKVQKAIDNAPPIEIDGKLFEQNKKDLRGDSEFSGKQVITRKEQDKYGNKLIYKSTGKKRIVPVTQAYYDRRAKELAKSNPTILKKLSGKAGYQLSHLSLSELDTLKNLGYLPAEINLKQYFPFEKKIVEISQEIYETQNNKKLSTQEKRAKIAELQRKDRELRKKFPQYAKTKARLNVRATGLDSSELMIKEKLPDPSIAIAPDEAGTQLKGTAVGSKKEKTLLEFGKKNLQKFLTPKHQKLIKNQFCPGNKVGGPPGACDISEAMDNMIKQTNAVKKGAIKGTEATRIANKASKVVRFGTGKGLGAVLGPIGLAGEAVFEVAFAVPGYARGETGKRLLGDSLLGLIPGVGQSAEEEFAEYATKSGMSELDQQKIKDADRFLELNNSLPIALKNIGKGGRGDPLKGAKTFEKQYKEYEPLYNQFVGGPPSESPSTAFAEQDRINQLIQADQAERAEKRNIALEEDFMAAEGGIASGPPPTGGPMSQGLRSLYNNGRKL